MEGAFSGEAPPYTLTIEGEGWPTTVGASVTPHLEVRE